MGVQGDWEYTDFSPFPLCFHEIPKKLRLSFKIDRPLLGFTIMKERTLPKLGVCAVAVALGGAAVSGIAAQPAKSIDLSKFPKEAQMVERVVVPVPSEVFSVLDKMGKPNWPEVLKAQKSVVEPVGSERQISLLLGTVIAEGFIAVEAESAPEVKNIGNSVRLLAKAIGVEKAVSRRATSIVEYAEKKRWVDVRRELDLALSDVRQAMLELNSEPLAQLVSLGGWLRGTEALAQVVGKSFSKDGAGLLHQPVLIEHFDLRLAEMPEAAKSDPLMIKIRVGLSEIQPLMNEGTTGISEKAVRKIGSICADLVAVIKAGAK